MFTVNVTIISQPLIVIAVPGKLNRYFSNIAEFTQKNGVMSVSLMVLLRQHLANTYAQSKLKLQLCNVLSSLLCVSF